MNSIYQINISKGGVPKLPIQEANVLFNGIEGDKQKDRRYHGGPERALCLFSIDLIEKLKSEGHPISAGSTGENITISFKDYHLLVPNVKLKLGDEVVIEITSYAAPCKTIKRFFLNEIFVRISQKLFPNQSRLYARVLKEGRISVGDKIEILS
ncbi:MAG TPA: MOSC domain-containing protein [Chitinophagaceae bacterium]|nr:MOSC domain-containing protein [Chitinophagaceae bacterium]